MQSNALQPNRVIGVPIQILLKRKNDGQDDTEMKVVVL
jgi:hypothetical protein